MPLTFPLLRLAWTVHRSAMNDNAHDHAV